MVCLAGKLDMEPLFYTSGDAGGRNTKTRISDWSPMGAVRKAYCVMCATHKTGWDGSPIFLSSIQSEYLLVEDILHVPFRPSVHAATMLLSI